MARKAAPKISVLVLSWKRPKNIQRIIREQTAYSCVDEILIFNNNSSLTIRSQSEKVKIINASADFGTRSRWALGALAKNCCLLFQDDDLVVSEEAMLRLAGMIEDDPDRAYSLHGRNPSAGNEYRVKNSYGEVDIVLTRATCLHKRMIPAVLEHELAFCGNRVIWGGPNGEDIFMSYAMRARTGKRHVALKAPFRNLPSPHAIAARTGHVRERTKIMRACQQHFAEKAPVQAPLPSAPSLPAQAAVVLEPTRIILQNHQAPGDILMLTATLRDLHLTHPGRFVTDIDTPFPQLWENNPYVTPLPRGDSTIRKISLNYPIIHESNEGAYHFIHGFRLDLEEKLGVSIKATKLRADLYFTEQERSWMSMVQEHFTGRDTPFWLICTGGKKDYTAKWWIPEYAQEVVDHFKDRIQFVQFGDVGPNHHHPPLEGVINLVGRTDLRMFMRLMYHAHGVICPVTFAMHLAAGVPAKPGLPTRKPCVVTAGGREPSTFTAYPNHVYLHANGQMRCADNGGCWRSRTSKLRDGDPKDGHLCIDRTEFNGRPVQRCMHDLVTAADVIRAVERYYIGGSLKYLPAGTETLHAEWENRITK